jgi:hypothetical protein
MASCTLLDAAGWVGAGVAVAPGVAGAVGMAVAVGRVGLGEAGLVGLAGVVGLATALCACRRQKAASLRSSRAARACPVVICAGRGGDGRGRASVRPVARRTVVSNTPERASFAPLADRSHANNARTISSFRSRRSSVWTCAAT